MKTGQLYTVSVLLLSAIGVFSVLLANQSLRVARVPDQRYMEDANKQQKRAVADADAAKGKYLPPIQSEIKMAAKSEGIQSADTARYNGDSFRAARELYGQKSATTGAPEIPVGILSEQPDAFFRALQKEIDEADPVERCRRYKGTFHGPTTAGGGKHRRIFYGALAASEPWELLEIVAAETHGVFAGMVWVESNRTQNFTPRPFLRLGHDETLRQLFGVDQVRVVAHVNEASSAALERAASGQAGSTVDTLFLAREHTQRNEIVRAWKEQGMTGDDVGLLVDMDETFTRDFLRAVQQCDGIPALEYAQHHCHHKHVKLVAVTTSFETSPECMTANRRGFHPDMIVGACIEGIGDGKVHPSAPREPGTFLRKPGYGGGDCDWSQAKRIKDGKYPLWDMSDFRRTCGGVMLALDTEAYPDHAEYTAYHFHNFFTDFNATRFKMKTYGHPNQNAMTRGLEILSNDLKLMYRCVKNMDDGANQKWKRVQGGLAAAKPFVPIYFQDEDYRRRRHAYVQKMVELDDIYIQELKGKTPTTARKSRHGKPR